MYTEVLDAAQMDLQIQFPMGAGDVALVKAPDMSHQAPQTPTGILHRAVKLLTGLIPKWKLSPKTQLLAKAPSSFDACARTTGCNPWLSLATRAARPPKRRTCRALSLEPPLDAAMGEHLGSASLSTGLKLLFAEGSPCKLLI